MSATPALSAPSAGAPFDTTTIERRDLGEHDVLIDIKFCGICHSDIHQVKDEWGGAIFPMVPGHEIAGVVAAVGSAVAGYSAGDRVGVGCLVDSCGECEYCNAGEEQFCTKSAVPTYHLTRVRVASFVSREPMRSRCRPPLVRPARPSSPKRSAQIVEPVPPVLAP